jgi:lipopolysaccharide transport system ATP-binding protein
VEKFVDTPVKRYSSGMKVRLGFAVAAHLEPEILIIDEVLAVGDIEFQKRCLGKMREVATSGRTVLFVSHKMGSIEQLCDRAILLDQGEVADDGEPSRVIHEYAQVQLKNRGNKKLVHRFPKTDLALEKAQLLNADGECTEALRFGEPFAIRLSWRHKTNQEGIIYNIRVYIDFDELLFACNTRLNPEISTSEAEVNDVFCKIEQNVLAPGTYRISAGAFVPKGGQLQGVDHCADLVITDVAWDTRHPFNGASQAKLVPRYTWAKAKEINALGVS